jgi:hypothetical protein
MGVMMLSELCLVVAILMIINLKSATFFDEDSNTIAAKKVVLTLLVVTNVARMLSIVITQLGLYHDLIPVVYKNEDAVMNNLLVLVDGFLYLILSLFVAVYFYFKCFFPSYF